MTKATNKPNINRKHNLNTRYKDYTIQSQYKSQFATFKCIFNDNRTNVDIVQCTSMDDYQYHRKSIENLLHVIRACDFQTCSFGKQKVRLWDLKHFRNITLHSRPIVSVISFGSSVVIRCWIENRECKCQSTKCGRQLFGELCSVLLLAVQISLATLTSIYPQFQHHHKLCTQRSSLLC